MEPITRKEKFLAKAAGDDVGELTPITREEYFIDRISGGGGGGESTIAWKPSVASDGTISWTRTSSTTKPADQNIKGPKGDTGDKGDKGDNGDQGAPGDPGEQGEAGVSPTVTITNITGGHRVTITDEEHPQGQSFDVMDGEGGDSGKVFVATYGSTTAQDILSYMDATKEPFAPIIIKRGNDYYTSILSVKQADNKVLLRCVGSSSGSYYIFNYTVTDGSWASNSQGLQNILESGVNVKTINDQPVLGSGNIDISEAFVATYGQTSYADLVAAIDANKPIIVDFQNNHNLMCVTYSTYGAAGSDVLMYAVYNFDNQISLSTITVKSTDVWSITHTSLQEALKSGINIKTLNGESLLGSGNIDIAGGGGIFVAVPDVTQGDEIVAAIESGKTIAVLSDYGKGLQYVLKHVNPWDDFVLLWCYSQGKIIQYAISFEIGVGYKWETSETELQEKLVSGTDIKTFNNVPILGSGNLSAVTMITDTQYQLHGYNINGIESGVLTISKLNNGDPTLLAWDKQNSREVFSAKLAQVEEYDVCVRDEAGSGNVVKIGSIKEGDTQYNLYQFYYRTDALPNATTGIFPFANLLANYTIKDFIDATGMTDNGIFIGNGRTDNNNRLIVQQFSKNNKTITIRAYQDFSAQNALLKIIFIGTKNS